MSVQFEPEIEWDGRVLSRWAMIDGKRIQFRITREMIHAIPIYSDLLNWEIERHKAAIFERFEAVLIEQLSHAD